MYGLYSKFFNCFKVLGVWVNNYTLLVILSLMSFLVGLFVKIMSKAYIRKFRRILIREKMQEEYEYNVPDLLGNIAEMSRQTNIFQILKYLLNQPNIIQRFPLARYLNEIYSAYAMSYQPNYEVYFTTPQGERIPLPKNLISMLHAYLVKAFPNSALLNMFYSAILLVANYGQDASDIIKNIAEISRENVEYLKSVKLEMTSFADYLNKLLKFFTPITSAISLVIFAGFSSMLTFLNNSMTQGIMGFMVIKPVNIPSSVLAFIFMMQLIVSSYLMSSFTLQIRGGMHAEKLRVYSFLDILSTSLIMYGLTTFLIASMLKGLFMT